MIKLGEYNELKVVDKNKYGFYLTDGTDEENILLPELDAPYQIGHTVKVFIFIDNEDRIMATTVNPRGVVGELVSMPVVDVTEHGAFLDWGRGMPIDVFVPFSKQDGEFEVGERYVVRLFLDENTEKVLGDGFIRDTLKPHDDLFEVGKKVRALPYRIDEWGYDCVINDEYHGFLHASEIFNFIENGQYFDAYVRNLREDGKMNLTLRPAGYDQVSTQAEDFYEYVKNRGGYVPYTTSSSADMIRDELNMSKKLFKKIIGSLYKERRITIAEDGIRIVE